MPNTTIARPPGRCYTESGSGFSRIATRRGGDTGMKFEVELVPSAETDLDYYGKYEQGIILDALTTFLETDAHIGTRRRKRLRANPLAPWELRVGDFRVFYEITEPQRVRVLAIGHKQHNDLLIRGERIIL